GGRLGDNAAARAYVKHFDRDGTRTLDGNDGIDDWRLSQAGFRVDAELGAADTFTLQGDVYEGDESALVRSDFALGTLPTEYPGSVEVAGSNLLARWERQLDRGASYRLQV